MTQDKCVRRAHVNGIVHPVFRKQNQNLGTLSCPGCDYPELPCPTENQQKRKSCIRMQPAHYLLARGTENRFLPLFSSTVPANCRHAPLLTPFFPVTQCGSLCPSLTVQNPCRFSTLTASSSPRILLRVAATTSTSLSKEPWASEIYSWPSNTFARSLV